ncbi:MAG: cobalamin-dependent protein, partial [Rhodospirillales bacterium]|nr:cobalamin-dependent protein [Rhodospirillales bacterium]
GECRPAMKICLIRPSIVVPRSNITSMFTPPLGLAYVAGTLRAAGFDVSFIDAVGESLDTRRPVDNDCFLYGLSSEQTIERIAEDVDVIGVHAGFSFEWPYCRSLIADIRRRFPETPLIGGGEHITAMPEASLTESALDLGVLGEGEETMLEVCRALAAGNLEPAAIEGIVFRDGAGNIAANGRRVRRRDIDAIARPAWDLLPIEAYLERGFGFGVNRGRSMPILGSRGCPYQCTFCSSPQMWTTRWLARDPDLLLDELADYQRDYKAENFDFYDLTAIVKKSWIVDFCRKIEERGMSFTWQLPSGTRSEAIDGEVAELLYRSGCRNLSYSPESGSAAVLARIKKRIKPGNMIESMEACHAQGINVKCNIMLGFPGETFKEVFESYRFIVRMALAGTYDLSVWAFSPYPGSELFEQFLKDGRIKVDDAYYDSLRSYADASRTKSYSENISDSTLKALRFGGLCLFYGVQWLRRPLRPFRMIWNVWRGTHESRAEMGLANLLRRGQLTTGAD